MNLKSSIIAALIICLSLSYRVQGAGSEEVRLEIEPGTDGNCYRTNDVAALKQLVRGVGFMECFPDVKPQMKRIGFQYYRIINVFADFFHKEFNGQDRLVVSRDGNGNLVYDFGIPLAQVKLMRECGGEPYIILGATIAKALLVDPEQGSRSLPIEKDYITFTAAALKALGEGGKKEVPLYVEVGNEFDSPAAWYGKSPYREKFENYFKLYRMVEAGVKQYEKENPELPRIRLGGPAATCYSFAHTFQTTEWGKKLPFNFVEELIRRCAQEKIRLDFIGIHIYTDQTPLNQELGHAQSYPDMNRELSAVKSWRDRFLPNAEIIVSEWGFSGLYDGMGMQNYSYIAAASGMEQLWRMLQFDVSRAIFLTMRLAHAEKYFPHLLAADGEPLPIYRLFEMIVDLQPNRVKLKWDPKPESLNAIASISADGKQGTVLLWNTRWIHHYDRKSPGYTLAKPTVVRITVPRKEGGKLNVSCKMIDMQTPSSLIGNLKPADYNKIRKGESLYHYKGMSPAWTQQISAKDGAVEIPTFIMLPESVTLLSWNAAD